MTRVTASTIVVISGPAIRAGSTLIRLAKIGRMPPTIFAKITVKIKEIQTVTDTLKSIFSK